MKLDRKRRAVIVLADGAGSAVNGRTGAQTAVTAVSGCGTGLSALQCVAAARRAVEDLARRENEPLEDYATTLLVAILTRGRRAIGVQFAQIGDGVIVSGRKGSIRALTIPYRGEHVNETVFLTGSAWESNCSSAETVIRLTDGVMLMSDGPMSVLYDTRTGSVAPACGEILDWGLTNTSARFRSALNRSLEMVIATETGDDCSIACAVGVVD